MGSQACDSCGKWFHANCLGVETEDEADLQGKFIVCDCCARENQTKLNELEPEAAEDAAGSDEGFGRLHSRKDVTSVFSRPDLDEIGRFLRQSQASPLFLESALQEPPPTHADPQIERFMQQLGDAAAGSVPRG